MGSNLSCVPQNNSLRSSSKSFIRRNSSRLFRKKNPEEGQVKSTSIINIMSSISPMKEMSPQDLQRIGKIKWDPPYDPTGGWKKSSINVKNYGRMIHSSKVQFRFLHCQDVHDCFLDLFQTHLHFLSNTTTGLTYQGTLPLSDLTICKLQSKDMNDPDRFAFQMDGIGLNPIIVYCSCQEEVDHWFSLLKEHVEASGGTVNAPEARTYARIRSKRDATRGKEELRNSVKYEPIYEWEGSQRESLGPITYVTKVRLQHLPCQDQYDRLLVMYPSTLIILSEESNRFFYKGKLPLNSINITTPCQDIKPNTFMIEGKLINPIVVSCLDKNDFNDWIGHFIASQIPVQIPPPPIYDIIYTPTKTKAPEFDRVSYRGSQRLRQSQNGRGSYELPLQNQADNPLSPGYSEPLCFISSRPTSTETGMSARLSSRSNSVSSQARPVLERRPPSSQRSSTVSADVPLSPVYSAPYSSVYCSAPHQQPVKVPLVKSNSWSTPQTSMKYHLSVQNRNSDMCPSRKPLSPLYDDPDTPGRFMPEDNYVKPAMPRQCWGEQGDQLGPQLLPSSFRLCAPPLGRRGKSSSFPEQEVESPSRREDVMSHSAAAALGHSSFAQAIYRPQRHQMSADYSQEEMAYLEPTEPDDQETDYNNIWDVDNYNGMIQPPLSPASDFDILEATGHDWKRC